MQPVLDSSPHSTAATHLPNLSSIPVTGDPPPRLFSIRLCIILCFAMVVVVTAASVAAVLITSTYKVASELQAILNDTMLEVQTNSEMILSKLSSDTLQMVDNLTNSSLAEQSELSEFTAFQISEMASVLMSRNLDLMEEQLEAQLGTVVTASRMTLKYISDFGLNISVFSEMLEIGREVFSSLSIEIAYG
eukprot:RCo041710